MLRFGKEMGKPFGKGLAAAAAGESPSTKLRVEIGGHIETSAVAVAEMVLASTTIEEFNGTSIKEMRADSVTTLDLHKKKNRLPVGLVVAGLMPTMGSLKSLK